MIILFHSEECKFCVKLLEYINTNKLNDFFKFINIDTLSVIPEHITIVPTVIDSSIEAPLEGKKAFEYVVNHKYFNHPTNNVDFWINTPPPKPTIEEDKKALDKSMLTIYTNLDDVNNKQPLKPQIESLKSQTDTIKKPTKQVYYKPVTKTTNVPPIVKKPVVAKINKPETNNDSNETNNNDSNKINNNDPNKTNNNNENQKIINNNLKKNMALMRLRR